MYSIFLITIWGSIISYTLFVHLWNHNWQAKSIYLKKKVKLSFISNVRSSKQHSFLGIDLIAFVQHKQILQNPIFQLGIKEYQRKLNVSIVWRLCSNPKEQLWKIWSFYPYLWNAEVWFTLMVDPTGPLLIFLHT